MFIDRNGLITMDIDQTGGRTSTLILSSLHLRPALLVGVNVCIGRDGTVPRPVEIGHLLHLLPPAQPLHPGSAEQQHSLKKNGVERQ